MASEYAKTRLRDSTLQRWLSARESECLVGSEAAANFATALLGSDVTTADAYKRENARTENALLRQLVATSGNAQVLGSPEQVTEGLREYSLAGVDGLALTFVDYEESIAQFADEILPLMRDAGLRSS